MHKHENQEAPECSVRGVVSMAVLAGLLLAGCTAAPAPCLIQRPPTGGYVIKFELQGTPPAGCDTILPTTYGDIWRLDGYAEREIYMKADSMDYPDEGGVNSPVLGHGQLSELPDADNICTIADVTPMTSETNPITGDPGTYVYHASNLRFLDGARYQGSTFEGDVDITIDACTGSYRMQGLSPSPVTVGTCEDESTCSTEPGPGRATGSGINPDYAIGCVKDDWVVTYLTGDPAAGICFFTKPFPGLK
jgi:hypothetical protein